MSDKIKTVGEVWAIYDKAGLTKPHISEVNFFEDAKILKNLLNDRNVLYEASKKALHIMQHILSFYVMKNTIGNMAFDRLEGAIYTIEQAIAKKN